MGGADPDAELLDALGEEYVERLRAGEAATPGEYARAHPALAARIRETFPVLALLEGLKPPTTGATTQAEGTADTAPDGDALPTSIGGMPVRALLGEGGMGRVYAATAPDGTPVAIKVVHPHLVGRAAALERFEREIEAGRQVVHPGVVRTLGAGRVEAEGGETPYAVLELAEGQTLGALLADVGALSERLACEIGARVADALAAIHAAGIVHRDIKPENVLIAPDETIKVMDLGVAYLADARRRMTATGEFVGTLLYAAPEQVRGDPITPATDMHALGLLLRTLVTGRAPRGVALGEARAARTDAPGISIFLDRLVAALLAEDPAARPGPASEVASILRARERSAWWEAHEAEASGRVAAPPREAVSFHGRQDELEWLDAGLAAAHAHAGPVRLVVGDAGIGKSRLLREWLARRDRTEDAPRVLLAAHGPEDGSVGVGVLSRMLLHALGRDGLDARLPALLGDQAALAPFLANELLDRAPDVSPLSPAARLSAWTAVLRALADDAPLVLLVEDLHFAGAAAQELVRGLAHAFATDRILLLLTARPTVAPSLVASLARLERFVRLDLAGLDAAGALAVIRDVLPDDRPASTGMHELLARAEGNPFFLQELARQRRGEGRVGPRDTSVPGSVQELVEARLAAVPEDVRELLGMAACAGDAFDPDLVCEAAGVPRLRGLRQLHRADRELELLRADGESYRFRHHLIQEVLRDELPPRLATACHQALAEAIERQVGDDAAPRPEQAFQLAHHFVRGDDPARALPHGIAALDHLLLAAAHQRGARLARRLLDVPGDDDPLRRAGILHRLGTCLVAHAAPDATLEPLREADALAEAHGDAHLAARVRVALAACLRQIGRYEEAEAAASGAVDAARALGDDALLAEALPEQASSLSYLGRMEDAERAARESLAASRAIGDARAVMRATNEVASVLVGTARLQDGEELLEGVVAMARLHGESAAETDALSQLAKIAYIQARASEATAQWEQVLEIALRTGSTRLAAMAGVHLGQVQLQLGRQGAAAESARLAVALCRDLGYLDVVSQALLIEGQALVALGRIGEGHERIQEGVALVQEKRTPLLEARLSTSPVLILAWCGRFDEAAAIHARGAEAARAAEAPREQLLMRMVDAGILDARDEHAALVERLDGLLRDVEAAGGGGLEVAQLEARLGITLALLGDDARARPAIERALAIQERGGLEGTAAMSRFWLEMLAGGSVVKARVELERHGDAMPAHGRLRAWVALAERTEAAADRAVAREEVESLVAHAPADWRAQMSDAVPLYRRVLGWPTA